jgi:hypothetical protein
MSIEIKPPGAARPVLLEGWFACRNHPIAYLNVPKSACTTIRNVMFFLDRGKYLDDPLQIHFRPQALIRGDIEREELLRRLVGKRFTFTFIREPAKRVYSCFVDKIYNVDKYSFVEMRKLIVKSHGLKFSSPAEEDIDEHRENFKKFLLFVIDNLAGKTEIRKDHHWLPQSNLIKHCTRDVPLDFVGIVESFADHFQYVLESAGITKTLGTVPKFNESAAISVSLADIMDAEIRELVDRIYQTDYELYNDTKARTATLMAATPRRIKELA